MNVFQPFLSQYWQVCAGAAGAVRGVPGGAADAAARGRGAGRGRRLPAAPRAPGLAHQVRRLRSVR